MQENSHFKETCSRYLKQLTLEQSDGIFGVSHISWESSPWTQLSLVNDEEVISLSHAKVHVFSDSVLCLGKMIQKPNIKYCLGTTVGMVQRFDSPQYRTLDTIDGEPMELAWNIFPALNYIGARPRSPKAHEQYGPTRTIPRTNYLHVDVQWHHMVK